MWSRYYGDRGEACYSCLRCKKIGYFITGDSCWIYKEHTYGGIIDILCNSCYEEKNPFHNIL